MQRFRYAVLPLALLLTWLSTASIAQNGIGNVCINGFCPADLIRNNVGNNDSDTTQFTPAIIIGNQQAATAGVPVQGAPGIQFRTSAYTDDNTNDPDNTYDGYHSQWLTMEYAPSTAVNIVTDEPAGTFRWKFCYGPTYGTNTNCRTSMFLLTQGNLIMNSSMDAGYGGIGDVSVAGKSGIYWRGCDSGGGVDTGTSTTAHCADIHDASGRVMTRAGMGSNYAGRWQVYGQTNTAISTPQGVELAPGLATASMSVSSCGTGTPGDGVLQVLALSRPSVGYLSTGDVITAAGGIYSCTLTFPANTWTNAPTCMATIVENPEEFVGAQTASVTSVVFKSKFNISDKTLGFLCMARV